MEIIFVRHAQPQWSRNGAADVDPGLTDLGRRQAAAVARRIGSIGSIGGVTELIASPATRARETAAPIAEALGMEPTVIDGIVEMQLGDEWHDTPAHLVEQMFRESRDRSLEEWWDGFPGSGESFRGFHARVCTALDHLLADRGIVRSGQPHLWDVDPDPGRIVVVAHAGTNSVALGHLLGLDPTPWEWERFASPHASIATIRSVPLARRNVLALYSFADTAHLETAAVTY